MVSDAQKAAVKSSWAKAGDHAALGEKVFMKFFTAHPEHMKHFSYAKSAAKAADLAGNAAVKAHGGKVMERVDAAVKALDGDATGPALTTLGVAHKAYNLQDSYFADMKPCFVEVVAGQTGGDADAWGAVYDVVAGAIMGGMHS